MVQDGDVTRFVLVPHGRVESRFCLRTLKALLPKARGGVERWVVVGGGVNDGLQVVGRGREAEAELLALHRVSKAHQNEAFALLG